MRISENGLKKIIISPKKPKKKRKNQKVKSNKKPKFLSKKFFAYTKSFKSLEKKIVVQDLKFVFLYPTVHKIPTSNYARISVELHLADIFYFFCAFLSRKNTVQGTFYCSCYYFSPKNLLFGSLFFWRTILCFSRNLFFSQF